MPRKYCDCESILNTQSGLNTTLLFLSDCPCFYFSSAKPPMIFQHTVKQTGDIKFIQKSDTKKEQAKQKQKLKEFQFKVMTYFQEEDAQKSEY